MPIYIHISVYRKTGLNNDNIKGFIYLSYDEVKQNSLEPIEMIEQIEK
jgi:hypothetical protein